MKRLISLALLLGAALPAGSAKIIGNGGDVLVCETRTPRVQLLDFVESRVLRRRTIQLWNPPTRSYSEKLDSVIENIEQRFPDFALQLRREIMNFESKNVKESDIELEDINDSYHKFRLPGCHVEQIANQSIPMFADDPWFLINANLWGQLEEFDKAGLVMHEVLYRMGLRHGVEHSIGIRYLNSLLFQQDLVRVTDQQWIEAQLHSRIKYFETGGLRFPLFSGMERNCEVVPGTVSCKGGEAEFRPAAISFDADRAVLVVNFEGIGRQNFEFSFGDYSASINTDKASIDWHNGSADFYAQGRLTISLSGSPERATAEVRGRLSPKTGRFLGDYRFVRADSTFEETWTRFEGGVADLYAKRPLRP